MNPNQLNLYIVDDDEAVRRSLASLLMSRLSDCAIRTFDSGEAFLQSAQLDASGVLVLDLRMQGMSGLDVFQALQERGSPLVVVFLSGHGDIPVAVRAMQQGAVSWLEKPCSDDRLMEAVTRAQAQAANIASTRRERQRALQLWARVTAREKQVAPLVAQGLSSKEVAQLLTKKDPGNPIDYRTVENHRAKIFAKLEVANSNALLVFLRDNGL
jgi:FixJ family two-component response regulator